MSAGPRSRRKGARKASARPAARRSPARAASPPARRPEAVPKPPPVPIRGGQLSLPSDLPVVPSFSEYTDDPLKKLFLEAYAQGPPRLGRAVRAAGISAKTAWNWRYDGSDPNFLKAFELAHKLAIEHAEGEMWRRGIEGYETPVYHQGQLVGTEREFDTTAAIFMLKAAKPDVYRERWGVEHSGPNGGPIQHQATVVLASLTTEELRARIAANLAALERTPVSIEGEVVRAEPEPESVEARAAAYAREMAKGNGGNGKP